MEFLAYNLGTTEYSEFTWTKNLWHTLGALTPPSVLVSKAVLYERAADPGRLGAQSLFTTHALADRKHVCVCFASWQALTKEQTTAPPMMD